MSQPTPENKSKFISAGQLAKEKGLQVPQACSGRMLETNTSGRQTLTADLPHCRGCSSSNCDLSR